jgi:hypothetical protein
MALLDDIKAKLSADGVFDGSTWKCYIGFLPDDQDNCIALFETGGEPPDTLARENIRPWFQARVRAGAHEYAAAHSKWQAVYDSLNDAETSGVSPDYLPGYVYIQAIQTGPLVFYDAELRPNMTVNFRALKTV